jgi:phosphosulfolactate phosphohydrolase-like enzyme
MKEHLMAAAFDEDKLKDILKSALVEALEEHRDLVQSIVEDAMEDFALARAIEQGLEGESASRDEIFAILEGAQ